MSKGEILHTRIGEMLEMIDCHAIANGVPPRSRSARLDFIDILKLR